MIPEHLKKSLDAYVERGRSCGAFLTAVLSNDLMEAFARADENNRLIMFDICKYVYNEIPPICWGSRDKVKNWIEFKGIEKEQRRANDKSEI